MNSPTGGELSPASLLLLGYLSGCSGHHAVDQLQRLLGLPTPLLREAVDELADAGLVMVTGAGVRRTDTPLGARPLRRPNLGYEAWQRARLAGIVRRVRPVVGDIGPNVSVVRGQAAVRETLGALFSTASSEILSISPPPMSAAPPSGRNRKALAELTRAERSGFGRGVRFHWLTDTQHLRERSTRAVLESALDGGELVHCAPDIGVRTVVVDRRFGVVPLDLDNHDKGALVLRDPELVAGLVTLFHEMVADARVLQREELTSAEEEKVLALLARGAKDETIARELCVSPRTVRRIVAGLMIRAAADSRFQLALHAIQAGWIPVDPTTTVADLTADRRTP